MCVCVEISGVHHGFCQILADKHHHGFCQILADKHRLISNSDCPSLPTKALFTVYPRTSHDRIIDKARSLLLCICLMYLYIYTSMANTIHACICRVSFGGGGGIFPPLEFEKAKLLDMCSTSVNHKKTLVVSLGKHDITNSKNKISRLTNIAAD